MKRNYDQISQEVDEDEISTQELDVEDTQPMDDVESASQQGQQSDQGRKSNSTARTFTSLFNMRIRNEIIVN